MAAFQSARSKDIDRADRVASLIDNGRCEAAHQLALSEGDRRMAGRATRICNERPTKR